MLYYSCQYANARALARSQYMCVVVRWGTASHGPAMLLVGCCETKRRDVLRHLSVGQRVAIATDKMEDRRGCVLRSFFFQNEWSYYMNEVIYYLTSVRFSTQSISIEQKLEIKRLVGRCFTAQLSPTWKGFFNHEEWQRGTTQFSPWFCFIFLNIVWIKETSVGWVELEYTGKGTGWKPLNRKRNWH